MQNTKLNDYLMPLSDEEKRYKINNHNYFPKVNYDIINGEKMRRIDIPALTTLMMVPHLRYSYVPLHGHNYIELNYVYAGEVTQIINNTERTLTKGSVTFIDTNTIHAIGPTTENDILINFIIPQNYLQDHIINQIHTNNLLTNFFFNALTKKDSHFMVMNFADNERFQIFMNALILEFFEPSLNTTLYRNHLFDLVILEMINNITDHVDMQSINHSDNIAINAIDYIQNHYQQTTLRETAEVIGVSPNYLTQLLKKTVGKSFKEIVVELKMKKAAQMLVMSNEAIDSIAHECGYYNLTYFYKKFDEIYGMSPRDYRIQKHIPII